MNLHLTPAADDAKQHDLDARLDRLVALVKAQAAKRSDLHRRLHQGRWADYPVSSWARDAAFADLGRDLVLADAGATAADYRDWDARR